MRGLCVAFGFVLLTGACDRFPRDNPNDPGASAPLSIVRGQGAVSISDLNSNAPANNENGRIEPGETVLVTVPIDVSWTKGLVMANASVTDLNEDRCFVMALEQGPTGNQFMLILPSTRNVAMSVPVGPTRVTVGNDCEPGTNLEFQLEIGPIGNSTFQVPFELEVSERMGKLELVVELDDTAGNGDGKLDPGESVQLAVSLENVGKTFIPGVEMEIPTSGRKCVASVTPSRMLVYGDLLPSRDAEQPLDLVVDASCSMGEGLVLPFEVSDASGQVWPLEWSEPIRAVIVDAGTPDDDDAGR